MSISLDRTEPGVRAYTGGMLEQVRGPADLQHLSQSAAQRSGAGNPPVPDPQGRCNRWTSRPQPRVSSNSPRRCTACSIRRTIRIVFDTGHQAYVHKMLTGRAQDFDTLRMKDGLSGYPSRSESEHDWVESSHASTALSYADGLAKAFELTGHRNRHVVAVVGDGALTGGMCWEALNNIATRWPPGGHRGQRQRPQLRAHHRRVRATISRACGCSRATSGSWKRAARRCAGCPMVGRVLLPVHAQHQGRHQGCGRPAGDVHRPRHLSTSVRSTVMTSMRWRTRCGTPVASTPR